MPKKYTKKDNRYLALFIIGVGLIALIARPYKEVTGYGIIAIGAIYFISTFFSKD